MSRRRTIFTTDHDAPTVSSTIISAPRNRGGLRADLRLLAPFGRSAVEAQFIRGRAKMEARVTLALLVMLAMALGRIRADQAKLMRSLTAPVRRAS